MASQNGVACGGYEKGTIILTRFLARSDVRLFIDWKSRRQNHKKRQNLL